MMPSDIDRIRERWDDSYESRRHAAHADIHNLLAAVDERDTRIAELEAEWDATNALVFKRARELDSVKARVRAVCDRHEWAALRWADPLPVPEWVEQVRTALREATT